jgi:hypothetical protein
MYKFVDKKWKMFSVSNIPIIKAKKKGWFSLFEKVSKNPCSDVVIIN